jgi:hypothetical protein
MHQQQAQAGCSILMSLSAMAIAQGAGEILTAINFIEGGIDAD